MSSSSKSNKKNRFAAFLPDSRFNLGAETNIETGTKSTEMVPVSQEPRPSQDILESGTKLDSTSKVVPDSPSAKTVPDSSENLNKPAITGNTADIVSVAKTVPNSGDDEKGTTLNLEQNSNQDFFESGTTLEAEMVPDSATRGRARRNFRVPRELRSQKAAFSMKPSLLQAFKACAQHQKKSVNDAAEEALLYYLQISSWDYTPSVCNSKDRR